MAGSAEIEDAEVVSEGPKPPPPPPRAAELKPAKAGEAFSVFDGPVHDAKNAKAPVDPAKKKARQDAKARRSGKKSAPSAPKQAAAAPGAAAGPAAVDEEALKRLRARQKAMQALKLYEAYQLTKVREVFGPMLEPPSLEQLCNKVAFSPMELEAMGVPLAQGIYEMDIDFPWWVDFGVAFGAAAFVRHRQLKDLELKIRGQYEAANSNTEKPAPAPAAAAA